VTFFEVNPVVTSQFTRIIPPDPMFLFLLNYIFL
jgi:hypothetical protein